MDTETQSNLRSRGRKQMESNVTPYYVPNQSFGLREFEQFLLKHFSKSSIQGVTQITTLCKPVTYLRKRELQDKFVLFFVKIIKLFHNITLSPSHFVVILQY